MSKFFITRSKNFIIITWQILDFHLVYKFLVQMLILTGTIKKIIFFPDR